MSWLAFIRAEPLPCFVMVLVLSVPLGVVFCIAPSHANPAADEADCRRDRGVPVRGVNGSAVCISSASVIWESDRRRR